MKGRGSVHKSRGQPGFTLVELLVVIAVVAVLAATALSIMANSRRMAYDVTAKHDLHEFAKAWDSRAEGEAGLSAGDGGVLSGDPGTGSTFSLDGFSPSEGVVITATVTQDDFTARAKHVQGEKEYVYQRSTGKVVEQ
ncbi:MAG: prepilin-type N-terminal cleavage/methylation domain-containing protein [Desulfatibacillaceae bacterium]